MNKHKLILLMLLIALYSSGARAGQITHTVTYDPSKLSITYDTINGTSYAVIDYEWLNSSGSESEPLLPCDVLNFSIPYNANNLVFNAISIVMLNLMFLDLSSLAKCLVLSVTQSHGPLPCQIL